VRSGIVPEAAIRRQLLDSARVSDGESPRFHTGERENVAKRRPARETRTQSQGAPVENGKSEEWPRAKDSRGSLGR